MIEKGQARDRQGLTEEEYLNSYQADAFPHPSVATDMTIFSITEKAESNYRKLSEKQLSILLIQRGVHQFLGRWALPGGFVRPDETTEQAAQRELFEETGLRQVYMEQLYTFSEPKRDPRTWVMSCSYMALIDSSQLQLQAGDDADNAKWFSISFRLIEEHKSYQHGENQNKAQMSESLELSELLEAESLTVESLKPESLSKLTSLKPEPLSELTPLKPKSDRQKMKYNELKCNRKNNEEDHYNNERQISGIINHPVTAVLQIQCYELILSSDDTVLRSVIQRKQIRTEHSSSIEYTILENDGLAFDHAQIIAYALERLRGKVEYTGLALHLMPSRFTLTQLQQAYEVILGKSLLKPAFRRKIAALVEETDCYTENEGHRPSRLYRRKWEEL